MPVVIATAERGNTFHSQGLALGDLLAERAFAEKVEVVTSTGSVANAEMIGRGDAQFGFMAANWVPLAVAGQAPFDTKIPLALVSPVNSGPLFFAVRAESPVKTFADLRGRKVAVGYRESGMVRHVMTILDALGWSFEDIDAQFLGQAEGSAALAAGKVDAQFQPPVPNIHFTALTEFAAVRAVPFASAEMASLIAKTPAYGRATIKAGAFRGQDEDVELLAVLNLLMTNAKEDDARVAAVARLFADEPRALADKHSLYATLPELVAEAKREKGRSLEAEGITLHPAARRAFQGAGVAV